MTVICRKLICKHDTNVLNYTSLPLMTHRKVSLRTTCCGCSHINRILNVLYADYRFSSTSNYLMRFRHHQQKKYSVIVRVMLQDMECKVKVNIDVRIYDMTELIVVGD